MSQLVSHLNAMTKADWQKAGLPDICTRVVVDASVKATLARSFRPLHRLNPAVPLNVFYRFISTSGHNPGGLIGQAMDGDMRQTVYG